ncbi:MAG TPA: rhodanese-like domain-containing protein [Candidatus Elarobacter sp.]|jgi:3-mercaptopyruvate sulfurtransferase SseA|nr:rhodanese-like domain-containing protein [Candidatus Elarobacter sp.]
MNISVEELRALGENGATVLDVGKREGRREIRGAVRYRPHDLLTPDHLAIPIAPDKPVVLYDEKGDGDLTQQIAAKLTANGFSDVRVLTGGFAAWEAADGPTQEASQEQVVPPTHASEVQSLDRRI